MWLEGQMWLKGQMFSGILLSKVGLRGKSL